MSEHEQKDERKPMPAEIIREANQALSRIQSGQSQPHAIVINKTGQGHYSARIETQFRPKVY